MSLGGKMRDNTGMEKKKVLYFVPEFPRISETFIEREVAKLIEWGNLDIQILALTKASGNTSDAVLKRTVYTRLGIGELINGLTYLFKKPNKVVSLFFKTQKTNQRNLIQHLYFFVKALGYTKIIGGLNPNHIHVHFLSWPSTLVMVASEILTLPFSVSAHARDVFLEGELLAVKAQTCKFMSICNSYAYKKALEKITDEDTRKKVKLIYHGINPDLFTKTDGETRHEGINIFLGGTRLVEKKGLKYMIQASYTLKNEGFTHTVDIVGPGPLYPELKKQIAELGLEDTVLLHGEGKGTPFSEVLDYYKKANLFVFPSIETAEGDVDGVPTVVIEAAMAKLPIIATNAGAITDLIENDRTGVLIPQRDAKAIAEAVKALMQDTKKAATLAENAYTKAVAMFNIETNIGQLEKLLI